VVLKCIAVRVVCGLWSLLVRKMSATRKQINVKVISDIM